jgi:hypothetical protein
MSQRDLPVITQTTASILNLTTKDVRNSTWAPLRRLSEIVDETIIGTITTTQQISVMVETEEDPTARYDELSLALDQAVLVTGSYTLALRENAVAFHSTALDYATTIDVKVGPPDMKPKVAHSSYTSSLTFFEIIAITIAFGTFLILICMICVFYCVMPKHSEEETRNDTTDIEK